MHFLQILVFFVRLKRRSPSPILSQMGSLLSPTGQSNVNRHHLSELEKEFSQYSSGEDCDDH